MSASVPLSLYLELEKRQHTSLEAASKIALAWNDLIVEIFAIIDPSAEVRVELLDAVESSLGFRSLIKAVGKIAKQHPLLAGALSAALATFFNTPVEDISHEVWRKVYEAVGYSPEEAEACVAKDPEHIKAQAAKAQSAAFATPQKRELFVQLNREPVILSAGATPSIFQKPPPQLIIPKADFSARAGIVTTQVETAERKTITERLPVVLLTPKLKPKELMWEFADEAGHTFSAKMKDPDFINALEQGRTGAELKIGLQMEIEVKTKMETVGGIWTVKSREVPKVFSPLLPSAPDFFGNQ